jgi:hypothetical protein
MGVAIGGVSQLLKSRERLLSSKIKYAWMCLDHLKVEGRDVIEEGRIGSEPRTVFRLVVEHLLDAGAGFGHALPQSFLCIEVLLNRLLADIARR